MKVQFHDGDGLQRLESDKEFYGKFPPVVVTVFRRCMWYIDAVESEDDLFAMYWPEIEPNGGTFAFQLIDRWRLILTFDESTTPRTLVVLGLRN